MFLHRISSVGRGRRKSTSFNGSWRVLREYRKPRIAEPNWGEGGGEGTAFRIIMLSILQFNCISVVLLRTLYQHLGILGWGCCGLRVPFQLYAMPGHTLGCPQVGSRITQVKPLDVASFITAQLPPALKNQGLDSLLMK